MNIKILLSKNYITNIIAFLIAVVGYCSPIYSDLIFMTGSFALSGAITNWIAIYMLFDKVPYIYGSGVIPSRFKEFKQGIKQLIINEFFTYDNLSKFSADINNEFINHLDEDTVFNNFLEVVEQSNIGSMLSMIGGKEILLPLKQPMLNKLKNIIKGEEPDKNINLLISKIEAIIDKRLVELTPEKVKNIIQEMIRKHLGWLVVWGGVFGGLIGLGVSLF